MDNLYEMVLKADTGDPEAQYKAAYHILNDVYLDENDKEIIAKAVDYLRNASMSGYLKGIAAVDLGKEYYSGRLIERDYRKAVKWFRTSVQKLQPIGYYHLGICFLYGHGVSQDYAKAFDSFLKGSLTGYINNSIKLGDMFKKGLFVEEDHIYAAKLYHYIFNTALDLYERNGIYSDAYGQVCLRLGECYLRGLGVIKDIEEANYYFMEAKEHTEEAHWLYDEDPFLLQLMNGAPYINNAETTPAFEDTSKSDFISLINEKLPVYNLKYYPENELADLCALNPLIAKFDDEPLSDIFKGVQAGDPRQMYVMAMVLLQGDANYPENPAMYDYGLYLLHQSLLGGSTDPLEMLGLCYYGGYHIEKSYETALFLYGLSEYPMAFGEIGVCYANGNGVDRDYMAAYLHFAKCLLLDSEKAGDTYENLTIIYPHLENFEHDQAFVDYCHYTSEKYTSDGNDTF